MPHSRKVGRRTVRSGDEPPRQPQAIGLYREFLSKKFSIIWQLIHEYGLNRCHRWIAQAPRFRHGAQPLEKPPLPHRSFQHHLLIFRAFTLRTWLRVHRCRCFSLLSIVLRMKTTRVLFYWAVIAVSFVLTLSTQPSPPTCEGPACSRCTPTITARRTWSPPGEMMCDWHL